MVIDSGSGITTTYYYDFIDRLAKYTEKGTNYSHSVEHVYDTKNNLSSLEETINGVLRTVGYSYDDDNRLQTVTGNGQTVVYTYDDFGRVEKQEVKNGEATVLTTTYTYRNPKTTTTSTQISSIQQTADNYSVTYTYTYDGNGNILSISDGTNTITYEYDVNNQLIREDDPIAGTSREFQYRSSGQMFLEAQVPYTTGNLSWYEPTVLYSGDSNWEDMLTDVNGQTITRDSIGNMLSFDGYTYTWEHGRELAAMADSTGTWAFTYDANGMRTKRVKTNTSGAVTDTYRYVYNGSQLSQMTKNGNVLNFFYDGEGTPVYFTVDGTMYYYVTNLQGDVVAILDSTGTMVVNYYYDAYGVLLQTGGTMAATLGTLNPLTYRGYVYDHETGLYYPQSRYYNPAIRQFMSPDAFVSTGQGVNGYNMFAYCGNNPVNYSDPAGTMMVIDKRGLGGGGSVDDSAKRIVNKAFEMIGDALNTIYELTLQPIVEDLSNYDVSNTSEQKVFDAHYFSCYKGAFVLKTSLDTSFSYGIIGLSRLQQDVNTLRHEYGHVMQLQRDGVIGYTFGVMIPSMTINVLDRYNKLPYDYYSYPFEAEANILGGAEFLPSNLPMLPAGAYNSYFDLLPLFFE